MVANLRHDKKNIRVMLKEKLVDRGIDESRIKIDAKGAVGFIGSNDTKEGREKNNRIVIKIK